MSTIIKLENRYVRAILVDVICDWMHAAVAPWEPTLIGFPQTLEEDVGPFVAANLQAIGGLADLADLLHAVRDENVESVELPRDRECVASTIRKAVEAARNTLPECPSELLNGRVKAIHHAEAFAESLTASELAEVAS